MSIKVTQALLTRHANRFALEKVYAIAYTDEGLEIGIVYPDERKERQVITLGATIELGGEKWQVQDILPGVHIPVKGEVSTDPPRAVALLETNI